MEIFTLITIFVIVTIIGYLLYSLISFEGSFLEKISTGYLLGVGVSTISLFISNVFGLRFSLFNIYLILIGVGVFLVGCILIKLHKFGGKTLSSLIKDDVNSFKAMPNIIRTSSLLEKVLIFVLFSVFVSSAVYNLYWPIADWDALTLYDFRGRVFAISGFMDEALSIHRYYLGYPLLTSISHTIVYLTGFQNPHILYSLNYFAFVISFFCLVHKFANRIYSLLFAFLLAVSTQIYSHSTLAYTNLPYAVYYSLGFIYLFFWFKTKKIKYLLLSSTLVGISAWVRNSEPFWIVPLFFVFIVGFLPLVNEFLKFGFRRGLATFGVKKVLASVLPAIIYALIFLFWRLPWQLFISTYYKEFSASNTVFQFEFGLSLVVTRLFEVAGYIYRNVIKKELVLYLMLFSGTFLINKKNKDIYMYALMVLSNLLIVFGGTYLYSFVYPKWTLVGDSVSRMSIIFIPLTLFLAVLVLTRKKEKLTRRIDA